MQIQKKQKASILIWVFFLTLLMSFSFIFIQFQIKNSLSTNSKKLDSLEKEKNVQEFLWDINSKTQKIWENTLEIKDFSSLEYSLKKDEKLELDFKEDWELNLELLNSWIISYAINTEKLWKYTLPKYWEWIRNKNFSINSWDILKIKNFSWYSKIRIGASKRYKKNLNNNWDNKTYNFLKAWKITISLKRRRKYINPDTYYTWSILKYETNYSWNWIITASKNTNYTNKSFFIKSWDNLKIINKTNIDDLEKKDWTTVTNWFDDKITVIVSWDYNISNMLKNNSYKISKKTWWREIVLEKGKIK